MIDIKGSRRRERKGPLIYLLEKTYKDLSDLVLV